MHGFLTDLRSGFRILTKSPGPAVIAVLVLAIGIGLSTAMFSIVYGILLRGLPFEEGHRLMHLETQVLDKGIESREVSVHDFLDWRSEQTSFESLSAFTFDSIYLSGDRQAERFSGSYISADGFEQLRVKPAFGRDFDAADDRPGAPLVVILGHHVWRNRYGPDPAVIGRPIQVNGEPATIIGVMPPKFKFPMNEDLWLPLRPDALASQRGEGPTFEVFGRLRDGVTLEEARLELATISQRLEMTFPESNEGMTAKVQPYIAEFMDNSGGRNTISYTGLGAVGFVLLIACFNVANLLLARTTVRSRELALRTTLGAGRGRMMAQILCESFSLAVIASAIGVILARWGIQAFNQSIESQNWPFWFDIRLDGIALAVVLGLALAATLIAGILPALRASKIDINTVLKGNSHGTSGRSGRLNRSIVIAEVALSCTLLVGAGLLIRSVVEMGRVDLAYTTDHLLTGSVGLPDGSYPDDASIRPFYEQLHRELDGLPGVVDAALITSVPLTGSGRARYGVEGKSYETERSHPITRTAVVSPSFFETFEIAPVAGRTFETRDDQHHPGVVIVNRSFALREWPNEDAIGQQIRMLRGEDPPWLTVVGVVPDLNQGGLVDRFPRAIYLPMAQHPRRFMSAVIKTVGDPSLLIPSVRERLAELDAEVPLYEAQTMEEVVDQSTFFTRLVASVFSILALAALILAATGMYSVLAFSVSRRKAEVGVRMALGAAAKDIQSLIVGQGMRQVAVGLALGLLLAAAVARLLSSQLFGIEALDALTFGSIAALLMVVGLLASWIPALRASRVQPVEVLHCD